MVLTKFNLKRLFSLIAIFLFAFTLVACGENEEEIALAEAQELLDEAKTSLLITDMSNIVNSLDLPATGRNDVTITWSSNKTQYLANTGAVTRPTFTEGDQTVVLTATLTITYNVGDKADSVTKTVTTTKEFTLRVRALSEAQSTTQTIAQAKAATMDSDVAIEGVVFAKFNDANFGFFVADATGGVFVYARHTAYVLGDLLRITGKRQAYYGAPQIAGTVGVEKLSGGNALPTPVVKTVDAIAKEPANSAAIQGDLNLVEAKLIQKTEGANKNYYLQDPFTGAEIQIYYRTYAANTTEFPDRDPLFGFVDKYVRIRISIYYFDNRIPMWSIDYTVTPNSIVEIDAPQLSDAQKVAGIKAALTLALGDKVYKSGATVTLPATTEAFGGTITWAATGANASLINTTTGVLETVVANSVINLTATITVGDETDTLELSITVEKLELKTIAEARALAAKTNVDIEGVVVSKFGDSRSGFYVVDATGMIYVHGNHSALAVGDKVVISGMFDLYYGAPQIAATTAGSLSIVKTATGQTLPTPTPATVQQVMALVSANLPHGNYYAIEGVLQLDGGTYYIKDATSADRVMIYLNTITNSSGVAKADAQALLGKTVTVYAIVHDYHSTGLYWRLAYASAEELVLDLTDAQKVAAIKSTLTSEINTKSFKSGAIVTLPATSDIHGGTISWTASGDNASLINTTTGQLQNVVDNKTITLTATITVGEVVDTVVVEITVEKLVIKTIAQARALDAKTNVDIEGVVVSKFGDGRSGYYVADATGVIYVHGNHSTLAVGDKVVVSGMFDLYYSAPQIAAPVGGAIATIKTAEAQELPTPTPTTIQEVMALVGANMPHGNYYILRGILVKDGTSYYIKDVASVDRVMIYFNTIASSTSVVNPEFLALLDKEVFINVLVHDYHSTGLYWRLAYVSAEEVDAEMTDEQKATAIETALTTSLNNTEYNMDTTITLPATNALYGGTITWASNNAAVNATTGAIGSVTEDTVVTLIATITVGSATPVDVEIDITVKFVDPSVTFATDLFISYYVEGSSYNKILVIHNNTGATVDLSTYKAGSINNAGVTGSGIVDASDSTKFLGVALTGILAQGKSIILYNSQAANAAILAMIAEADAAGHTTLSVTHNNTTQEAIAFNGNGGDVIVLLKNGALIDVIGLFGETVASSSIATTWETSHMLNKTLVRKADHMGPSATNNWDQWEVNVENYVDAKLYTWK